jgi:hypothetical protein
MMVESKAVMMVDWSVDMMAVQLAIAMAVHWAEKLAG